MSTEYKDKYVENVIAFRIGEMVELIFAVIFAIGLVIVIADFNADMNAIGNVVTAFGGVSLCGGYLIAKYYRGKVKRKPSEEF